MLILDRDGRLSFRERLPSFMESRPQQPADKALRLPVAWRAVARLALMSIAAVLGASWLVYTLISALIGG